MVKRFLPLLFIVTLLVHGCGGYSGNEGDTADNKTDVSRSDNESDAPDTTSANAGELYSFHCASCHGVNGEGASSEALDSGRYELDELTQIIHSSMPIADASACINSCAEKIAELILADFQLDFPPLAPGQLIAEVVDDTSVRITWQDQSLDETGFTVFARLATEPQWQSIGSVETDVTEFLATNLDSDQNYLFAVEAFNEAGTSLLPTPVTAHTSIPALPPESPTQLTATVNNTVNISLQWESVAASASGFLVQRQSADESWVELARIGGNSRTYMDLDLPQDHRYQYRVIGFNGAGESSSEIVVATTGIFAPQALYEYKCAGCHGSDGQLDSQANLAADIPLQQLLPKIDEMLTNNTSCSLPNCREILADYIRGTLQTAPVAAITHTASGDSAEIFTTLNFSGANSSDNESIQSWLWTFGDGSTASGREVVHSYLQTGSFTVQLLVTDAAGLTNSQEMQLTVVDTNTPPTANAGLTGPLTGLAPLVVNFDASASSDLQDESLSYSWQLGDGQSSILEQFAHTYTEGVYSVVLTVTDSRGASSTDTVEIRVEAGANNNNPPIARASTSLVMGQAPITINFDASGSSDPDGDALNYLWQFGDGNSSNSVTASHTFTNGGTFTVVLQVTDSEGLPASDSIQIVIADPNQPPSAVLTTAYDEDRFAPLIVALDASGSTDDAGISSYQWQLNGASISADASLDLELTAGDHTVGLTVTDSQGLTATEQIQLLVVSSNETQRYTKALEIINNNCMKCHNGSNADADLWGDLDSVEALHAFAYDLNNSVVIPGDRQRSDLLNQIAYDDMPPSPEQPLSQQEKLYLSDWVERLEPVLSNGSSFACNVDSLPSITPLKRLSKLQYENTLHTLLEMRLGSASATTILQGLEAALALVPEDIDAHSFNSLDQRVSESHVNGYFAVAKAFAEAVTETSNLQVDFVGDSCAADASNVGCRNNFIESFAPEVLRRPLLDSERTLFQTAEDYYEIIAVLLMSPKFIYLTEFAGSETDANQIYQLDEYELASRISYLFWQTMPDEQLFAEAESGAIRANLPEVIARVFADDKTRAANSEFYRGWLKLEETPRINAGNAIPGFAEFLGVDYGSGNGLPAALDLDSYRQGALDEVLDLTDYYTWQADGQLSELFNSPYSFASEPNLAQAYGVNPWTQGDFNNLETFVPGERSGLLTRAALQIYGGIHTRPVMKGVRIRRDILCDELEPPADNSAPDQAVILPHDSTRDKVVAITEIPDTSCRGCHADQINPLGFPSEEYDSLGRHRSFEVVFSTSGEELGRPEIDSSTMPQVEATDNRTVSGAVGLSDLVAESVKTEACFVRNYFRHSYGRHEDLNIDGCSLQQLETALRNGNIREMMRSIALQPEFGLRRSSDP